MLDVYRSMYPWKQQLLMAQDSNTQAVRENTRAVVASEQALAREFSNNFNALESTIAWESAQIQGAIADLGATFSYGISLVVAELQVQNQLLDRILNRLDAIYEAVITPRPNPGPGAL